MNASSGASATPLPVSGFVIGVRYVGCAIISTVLNLLSQEAAFRLIPVYSLPISIVVGTLVGFAVRYVLDKRWVFFDAYHSHSDEVRKVFLYGFLGVFTTLIFWGFELAAIAIFQTTFAKYTGAVVGLTIGYIAKYYLDRRFVFRTGSAL